MFEWLKKWMTPNRSLDKLEKDFEAVSPIPTDYTSPYPHREPDEAIELLSQPMDGEAHPRVRQITRELTGGLSERER